MRYQVGCMSGGGLRAEEHERSVAGWAGRGKKGAAAPGRLQ